MTEITPTIDHRTVLTADHRITIIIMEPVKFLEKESIVIKTDQKTTLNHLIEIIHNIQIDRTKTIKVVYLNINDKSIMYNLQTKLPQTHQELITQKCRKYNEAYTVKAQTIKAKPKAH